MEFSPITLALLGLLMAAWTALAAWAWLRGRLQSRKAQAVHKRAKRFSRMLDEAPAVPLLVRSDGRIEAPQKLAHWLGLDAIPEFLTELVQGENGLAPDDLDTLAQAVLETQKSGAPFQLNLIPLGSRRSLALRGALADPQVSPGGAALVWVFDFSDSQNELADLRETAANAQRDFSALVGLIESAPLPMWFRQPDGQLQLVNSAYVDAVGAPNAEAVIDGQIELVEDVEGFPARQVAMQAKTEGSTIERLTTATIGGQRRSLRVTDMPLGAEGVAGYAFDIEDLEEQSRAFRAFRDAQRSMLDQLSVGVAQFDASQQLIFANDPFGRIFALDRDFLKQSPGFARLIDQARDHGRMPEARDFPAWRKALTDWFAAGSAQEDQWALAGGTHLRIVAQPMPDGGLVMIAEDRTEQLALSAVRDTLLRTRTATFDSLFEALAAFAPDGKLQIWNRRFAELWQLDEELLLKHPKAQEVVRYIAAHLTRPEEAKRLGEVVRAAALDRKQTGGKLRLKDGRIFEFAGVPLPDGNALLTLLDVTDSQKAEIALRERNKALEEADGVKTRFLANMSYEFRTPLTTINGFAELLQAGVAGELSEQGQEYVSAIITSADRLSEQIETVLDLSQSEAGLLPVERERFELFGFVAEVTRSREASIKEAGLSVELRGNRSSGSIEADRARLSRAVGHVLDNAIAATPKGGKILVVVDRSKAGANIIVSDNGRGMTEGELAQALKGMERAGRGAQSGAQRQGLGLPLAKQLIEAHNGSLDIVSEKGAGTTVTITLP